jgi:hypothetical protein
MKLQLEQITANTCSNKIRVMRQKIVPEEFERCWTCNNYNNNYSCDLFKPYQFTFPVRKGAYVL